MYAGGLNAVFSFSFGTELTRRVKPAARFELGRTVRDWPSRRPFLGPPDRLRLGFLVARYIGSCADGPGNRSSPKIRRVKTRLRGSVMKANKALKRLAKIEALMSDLTERYSASAPRIRDLLQNAKVAVTQAKEAVGLQASSGTAKNPLRKQSKAVSKATPELSKPKRRLSAAGRKAIIAATKKRWALKRAEAAKSTPARTAAPKKAAVKKVAQAKTAKKSVQVKKATVKAAAKKTASAPAPTGTEV